MTMRLFLALLAVMALGAPAAMAGNDDSCDIGVAPAATLLLPYFEVDFQQPAARARTTIFTVTNVSARPQIAHVTLWTDWAYAAYAFNLQLAPYGVQSINLGDVFARGAIAPGVAGSAACANGPATLTPPLLADLRQLFTTGLPGARVGSGCTARLGDTHNNAIGYVTIDVVASCTTELPGPKYFTSDVLFDNVLIGDYENVDADPATGNLATGNPMVHIRAVPEGGPPGSIPGTNLPFTFYDRYTATTPQTYPRSIDRRQPLPSVFAARWIQGSASGFTTTLQIWREGVTGPSSTSCSSPLNSAIPINGDLIRFDEHENATSIIPRTNCPVLCVPRTLPVLPATLSIPTSSAIFPVLTASGDAAGWMYLNLPNADNRTAYGNGHRASQNWVSVTLTAQGRFAVQFDAVQLGNGCSPPIPAGAPVGPVGGVPVCPPNAVGCTPGTPPYIGTNVNPPPP